MGTDEMQIEDGWVSVPHPDGSGVMCVVPADHELAKARTTPSPEPEVTPKAKGKGR